MQPKERDALAQAAGKVILFGQAVAKLKRARDRSSGVFLTAADVDGIIWGIQTLRGPQDADADVPA